MKHMTNTFGVILCSALICVGTHIANAADPPPFKSLLFEKGTLVYSDDFDGTYSKERWGPRKKDRQMKDGMLIFMPMFKTEEEARKALGRDDHLGTSPLAHLNKIPEKFVCHMRYKNEAESITPGRPVLQIGHHMIGLTYIEGGGHKIKLPKGPSYTETESGMKINEWVDLVIEHKEGKILIGVNGHSKIYEHEKVTIINTKDKHGPRFSFKHGISGPKSRLLFDYVRLWKVD